MNWPSSDFPPLSPPTPPGLNPEPDTQVMSPSEAYKDEDQGWLAGSAYVAAEAPEPDMPKARLVLRTLSTDRPEEYDGWRNTAMAEIAGSGVEPGRVMGYINSLEQLDTYPAPELMKTVADHPGLKLLDMRVCAAVLARLSGSMQQAAEDRIRAQVPFGAGGLAIWKLDAWFNHGAQRQRAAATRKLLAQNPTGQSAGAMEAFLSSFRLLLRQAGAGAVGKEVQLDILQRATEGHPRLSVVWYAWKAAGGNDVDSLMDMVEEATADGMFGVRGARPGAAAWAAYADAGQGCAELAPDNEAERGQAAGRAAHVARHSAAQAQAMAPHASSQRASTDPRNCYTCGQPGHIARRCTRRVAGSAPDASEQQELLQTMKELVAELRSARSRVQKKD